MFSIRMSPDGPQEPKSLDDAAPLPWGGVSDKRSQYRLHLAYFIGLLGGLPPLKCSPTGVW